MATMTYDSLVNDLKVYVDRSDTPFVSQIPRLIDLAENRIASEIRGLGYIRVVTGSFSVGQPILAKPNRWRETISFNFGIDSASAARNFLRQRSYEYCRQYWPVPTTTGVPRYYADYNYENFLITPTPNLAYGFELTYHERPDPLTAENQVNWTTQYAPQLILYAALMECMPFLMRSDRLQEIQALYDRAAAAIVGEDQRRATVKHQNLHKGQP